MVVPSALNALIFIVHHHIHNVPPLELAQYQAKSNDEIEYLTSAKDNVASPVRLT